MHFSVFRMLKRNEITSLYVRQTVGDNFNYIIWDQLEN